VSYDDGARRKIDQLERHIIRLEDALLEIHGTVVNPRGYKMARPNRGPIGGIARRAAKREADK
jgi:hypothetical protein